MAHLSNYRIKRIDSRNIVIQKQRQNGNRWDTISYHGNSLKSLISGLFELIMSKHSPEAENLCEALQAAKLELIQGIDEVKKIIERDCKEL